jgi:hypothetical protein
MNTLLFSGNEKIEVYKRIISKKRFWRDYYKKNGITNKKLNRVVKGFVLTITPLFPGDVTRFYHIKNKIEYENFIDTISLEPNIEDINRISKYFSEYNGILLRRLSYKDNNIYDVDHNFLKFALESALKLKMHEYTAIRSLTWLISWGFIRWCGDNEIECDLLSKNKNAILENRIGIGFILPNPKIVDNMTKNKTL